MNRFVTVLAVVSIAAFGPAVAKHASHNAKTAQADTTAPSDQKAGTPSNLTGQKIYTSTGNVVGVVGSMSKDGQGQPTAIIAVEKKLGIGSTKVVMPVSQLQPRDNGGGYFTNMTTGQVRALPKAP
jgi:sporulation protein YlmC with PRC-barrel domain